ncbi:polyprenyl diphosphate synthase [Nanoarchaeota archaeon]
MKPKHIAIITKGGREWAKKNKKPKFAGYKKRLDKVKEFIDFQVNNEVPIMTYFLLSGNVKDSETYANCVDSLVDFFNDLVKNKVIHENKIKISILGKWYNLPGRLVDQIKNIIDETRDYDSYFLNFCINYNGQDEIVDACKLISRRVGLGKMDSDSISKETIKEDLYSSYFLPPSVIIVSGKHRTLRGFLLWDSTRSTIYFADKLWQEFNEKDLKKAIEYWKKYKY